MPCSHLLLHLFQPVLQAVGWCLYIVPVLVLLTLQIRGPRPSPRQEIAKMIGASREMVSRVMKGLETEGYIVPLPEGKVLLREKLSSYLA